MVSRETSGLAADLRALGLLLSITSVVIDRLELLSDILEHKALPRGLLGPGEASKIMPRHILESAALAHWIETPAALVDVGTGAGLPGLVLACLGIGEVTLLDAQARSVAFLREAVHELGINADVVHGRAEELAQGALRERYAVATARGLARPNVALELLLPLVGVGGKALVLAGAPRDSKDEGPCDSEGAESGSAVARQIAPSSQVDPDEPSMRGSTPESWSEAAGVSELLGGARPEVAQFAVPGVEESRWVTIVQKLRPTPDRYPRSAAAMRRRPLDADVT